MRAGTSWVKNASIRSRPDAGGGAAAALARPALVAAPTASKQTERTVGSRSMMVHAADLVRLQVVRIST